MKKKVVSGNIALFLLVAFVIPVFAQQSDYEIKESYNTRYNELSSAIQSVMSVAEVDSLKLQIAVLDSAYSPHQELLNTALYPETFAQQIEKLKRTAMTSEDHFLVIESQNERLSKLTNDLKQYKMVLANLNFETDSLRNAIKQSTQNEAKLNILINEYRASLEERDNFVIQMMDSVLFTYKEMGNSAIMGEGDEFYSGRIINKENPIVMLNSIINENIEILKAENNGLATRDYLRNYALQNRISNVWSQVGESMLEIYGGNDKPTWKQEIESNLRDWKLNASHKMWTSLDAYLDNNVEDIGAFDNNYSFFVALDSFVKSESKKSNKLINDQSYNNFLAFEDFWSNKIKNEWNSYVKDGEVLTTQQISSIDSELENWQNQARPSNIIIPILLSVVIISIGVFIYLLIRRNRAGYI